MPSGLPTQVTDDVETRHDSLVLPRVSDEHGRGRLEELDDLVDVLVRPDGGKRRLEQSPDGKLHHLGSFHGSLEERALRQRADEIPLIEYRKL